MARDVVESGDRPADEDGIEVTPEMIKAGVMEIYACGIGEPDSLAYLPEALSCAYRAMVRTSSRS